MKNWDTVAIVGVGLIGGSIGLALRRRRLARRVIGIGRRASTLRTAKRVGAVTETTTNPARGASDAELIIVCTPVETIPSQVGRLAAVCAEGALITDVGSSKSWIVDEVEKLSLSRGVRFLGSHPLAGSEKNGPAAADAELFQGRVTVLTPTSTTAEKDRKLLTRFWSSLGSRVVVETPWAHDRALAATSHLPHLAAAVLAAATPEHWLPLTAGGWLDTTRIAAGDPELWRQIFLSNRECVLESLDRFDKLSAEFRTALQQADGGALEKILTQAKRIRDAVGD